MRRTISTMRGDERRSNSFIMITWLKWDSFTTKFRQCSWDKQGHQTRAWQWKVWPEQAPPILPQALP